MRLNPLTVRRSAPLGIALLTFATFLPALANGFVDWDDQVNFLQNPHYRGLGWTHVRWMLTTALTGHWIPVTWLTLGLDYVIWGMNPLGYHLTSLMFHVADAVLFWLVALVLLRRAVPETDDRAAQLGAAVAALAFALHPLRAESVGWITERRDVVSGFFALLTTLAYLESVGAAPDRRRRWLIVSVGCFALAFAAKSIVMTLPVVLVILDVWPLRRLGAGWREWTAPAHRGVWAEKIPYAVVATVGAAVSFIAVWRGGFLTSTTSYRWPQRLDLASYSVAFYVRKTLLPTDLSPLYELPRRVSIVDARFLIGVAAVAAISLTLVAVRRRWPAGLAAWIAYVVMLAPVSGLVHAGHHLVADRYSYLACLPWALLAGGAVVRACDAVRSGGLGRGLGRAVAIGIVVWLLGLASLTWNQVQVWKDTESLWRYALEIDPDCALCHNQLGAELGNRGLAARALEHFDRALVLRPDDPWVRGNLGVALLGLDRPEEAIAQFRWVLARRPADPDVRNRLGAALLRQGRLDEATAELREALRLDPGHADALANLARVLDAQGRRDEARVYADRARAAATSMGRP